ncbi:MAG TPA: HNH endonuclease [Gemmataceae bacterium]|nr:HNH endonuclease [Gemmataceae bacterium]
MTCVDIDATNRALRSTKEKEGGILLPISRGFFTLIDSTSMDVVSAYTWFADVRNRNVYARRNAIINGKASSQRMHRLILHPLQGFEVDHINGNGLDNRVANLRFVTRRENNHNFRPERDRKTSRYKGVCWDNACQKWYATIRLPERCLSIGHYTSEEEAALAYNSAAIRHFGEHARINANITA